MESKGVLIGLLFAVALLFRRRPTVRANTVRIWNLGFDCRKKQIGKRRFNVVPPFTLFTLRLYIVPLNTSLIHITPYLHSSPPPIVSVARAARQLYQEQARIKRPSSTKLNICQSLVPALVLASQY